jgi:intracellular multiplication protein IcmL
MPVSLSATPGQSAVRAKRSKEEAPRAPKASRRSDRVDEDAKLEALVSELTLGEHASVIREVARLHQDTRHLKRQNLRIWSIAGVLATSLFVSIGAALWWFPKYVYIATTDNRAICRVNTQGDNSPSAATLEDFAKEAAIHAFRYDYINYRDVVNDVTNKWFTERGRKAFMKSLDDSGNLERVVKGRLIMKSFATNAAQLESEGIEGTQRFWIVHVPLAIEFYVGGAPQPANTQDFLAEVKVMQEPPSAINQKGIAVDNVVLKPWTRKS